MGSKKRLPQMAGGSASALSLSRPAQASLTLRPAGLLSRPKATFVTRLQPMRLPAQAARQLPDQSTTLRVDSSSTDDSRLRGALPRPDPCSAANTIYSITSSAREHCPWDRQTERLCRLEVNYQLEPRRLHHGQICGLGVVEYILPV